ncbi:tryptophan-rich sensory protein [Psychromicrobium lacuslunae]|uniref:DNA-binding protein n=1 Tax=Psychromicrobium lacuslunae TaxID=1618207 RepID=A0A0D4BZD7_9MICC|nr:tryptophan-rich sensory protein [Psychromicrobium lacuslunae]AJT41807.1 DNA-binding protein [Psychromicrobium lacuslunae]
MNPGSFEVRRATVTGGTGFVGSQLISELIERGWAVRALCRSRAKALKTAWGAAITPAGQPAGAGQVEVIEGDARREEDLDASLSGSEVAWYLLHSMATAKDFRRAESDIAAKFARAASRNNLQRIVYLGGLHPEGEELSEHLASRVEVGKILLSSGVPTAVLQAGVVIGTGSASFKMLRHLAERLPAAIGPRWLKNLITPISVRDAVYYLAGAADLPSEVSRSFDIGGPESVPYADLIKRYAKAVGLVPRTVLSAPVMTPNLGSQWIGLVTPVPSSLAKPLVNSLLHDTVVKERDIESYLGKPPAGLESFNDAVAKATQKVDTKRWPKTFLGTSVAVLGCAVAGSILTDPKSSWYRNLKKPTWQPPPLAFPLVWTALYADIAAISSLVIADAEENQQHYEAKRYRAALGLNLVLNASWCGLFFRSRRPLLATVGAAALAASTVDLVIRATKSAPQRGIALAPYAIWTSGAAVLSATIARLNR